MSKVGAAGAAGLEIPGYTLGARIGAGGFGEVYEARQRAIGRDVAIKVLHAKYSEHPDAMARFVVEARAVARLSHPNIVTLFDFGELADGRGYYVMERIDGRTLREILRERGRLPVAEALPILRGIAEAIDAAHAAGIAHRDLKPDNVFVTRDGRVKLIDFGLAKLTHDDDVPVTETGAVFGTPLYMSPEQCRGRGVALATDAYSFGIVAYAVLAGSSPFSGEALEVALAHLHDEPEPPSRRCDELDAPIDRVVLALLAKDPELRPTPLAAAVEAMAGERALPRRASRRRRRSRAIAAAAALIAGVGAGAWWMRPSHAERPWFTSERTARVRFDGIVFWLALAPDGRAVSYGDTTGIWRYELDTGAVTRVDGGDAYRNTTLPDGSQLVLSAGVLELRDVRTGARRSLADGIESAEPSRDGARIAATRARDKMLVVIDVATGTTREIASVAGRKIIGLRWSPSGREVLWGDAAGVQPATERLHATRVADGATRTIPANLLADATIAEPADYLDDDHLVYCSSDGPSIQVWSLAERRATTVRRLDPRVSVCRISASPRRVAILTSLSRLQLGALDLGSQPIELRSPVGDRDDYKPRAISDDGEHAYVFAGGAPWTRTRHGHAGPLERVSLTTGTIEPLAACPGYDAVVEQAGQLRFVDLTAVGHGKVLRLRAAASCATVERWRLDADVEWGAPACTATGCAIAGVRGPMLEIWRLPAGKPATRISAAPWERPTDEVGIGEVSRDANGKPFEPTVAVSPDGAWLVAIAGKTFTPQLAPAAGGPMRTIRLDGWVDAIAWGRDPDHFLVSGVNLAGRYFALARVSLSGEPERVWSSTSTFFADIYASGRSDRIATAQRTYRQELLVLER